MSDKKPSNADFVVQVVREAPEPLPFAEILERVNALSHITTRNPNWQNNRVMTIIAITLLFWRGICLLIASMSLIFSTI